MRKYIVEPLPFYEYQQNNGKYDPKRQIVSSVSVKVFTTFPTIKSFVWDSFEDNDNGASRSKMVIIIIFVLLGMLSFPMVRTVEADVPHLLTSLA